MYADHHRTSQLQSAVAIKSPLKKVSGDQRDE